MIAPTDDVTLIARETAAICCRLLNDPHYRCVLGRHLAEPGNHRLCLLDLCSHIATDDPRVTDATHLPVFALAADLIICPDLDGGDDYRVRDDGTEAVK